MFHILGNPVSFNDTHRMKQEVKVAPYSRNQKVHGFISYQETLSQNHPDQTNRDIKRPTHWEGTTDVLRSTHWEGIRYTQVSQCASSMGAPDTQENETETQ